MKAMELAGKVWDAATLLFSFVKVHAAYVYELEENLESLQRKWHDLQVQSTDVRRSIDDAESTGEIGRTNEVNRWLQRAQDLQEVVDAIQNEGSQETHNKCLSGCCPMNCLSSYNLGKEVVKRLNEVNELVNLGTKFVEKTVDIVQPLPPKPVDKMPLGETVGLDSMLNDVWRSLEDKEVGIIGIYGMGGAGKTTLLKRIHNEFGKRKHDFMVVLWVVVSKDLNINKIMNDIGNRLKIKDGSWNEISPDQRATKIYQVLRKKKYVLMLDDLWEKLEIDKVGVPHPNDTEYQSKILFTTRSKDMCAKMQAQEKFMVKCLLEEEAFALFCKKVGEETLKCDGEIPELAREIVGKCSGLPLALATVGSAMAGLDNVESWIEANRHLSSWTASGVEEKVFPILKFSYDRLPDEKHKRCFLYCSLYPEDYDVEVDVLVQQWIGEGFLDKDKTKKSIYDMYVEGKSIIEKLKLSCLLEGTTNTEDFFQLHSIKMHDVIRDMALWLSRDQDKNGDKIVVGREGLTMTSEMDSERLNVVERISIINAIGSWQVPACPNLITLLLGLHIDITHYSNLQYMTKLKVLDLSGIDIEHLLPEIGKLINLEFLNLSETNIKNRLPIELKNLKNLRVLLMENVEYNLEIIPLEVIGSLERLMVFRYTCIEEVANFEGEKTFLEKLESLPKLEELCILLRTITGMHKLVESTKLRGCSTHFLLDRIENPLEMASILEFLPGMKHLKCIRLCDVNIIAEGSSITNTCHLRNLRGVEIERCNSITHLTWLRYAPLLEFLEIWACESIEELVKEDGGSSRDTANDIFPNLTNLLLSDLGKLKSIHKKALAFPFLKYISVQRCPNLRKLPLNSNSAKDTLIEISGDMQWWNNLEWEDTAVKDLLQPKFVAWQA